MDNFDLRKYLTEGRLLKEAIDYSSIKGEMKKIYDIDVDLDTIKDFVISYNDSEGMDVFDTTEREDFYLYLKDEDRLLKEELTPLQQYVYNFEKEVSGEDNAKEFLDGIKKLNTPKDVYDYYAFERNWEGDSDLEGDLENLYNQVLDKFKSKNENKMDNFDLKKYLAEGKLLKEEAVINKSAFTIVDNEDFDYDEELKKAGPNAEMFSLVDGYIVDPNFKKYHSGTQEILGLADEQGHEWEDVESYFNSVEGHENAFKDYPDNSDEIPDDVLRDEAMVYGTDYGQFYGGDRDDYYQE